MQTCHFASSRGGLGLYVKRRHVSIMMLMFRQANELRCAFFVNCGLNLPQKRQTPQSSDDQSSGNRACGFATGILHSPKHQETRGAVHCNNDRTQTFVFTLASIKGAVSTTVYMFHVLFRLLSSSATRSIGDGVKDALNPSRPG